MIEKFDFKPEAYIKLWDYYFNKEKNYKKSLEITEKLFLLVSDIEFPQLKIIIALIYAKTLFKNQRYFFCFELLQLEFSSHPEYPIFLYKVINFIKINLN